MRLLVLVGLLLLAACPGGGAPRCPKRDEPVGVDAVVKAPERVKRCDPLAVQGYVVPGSIEEKIENQEVVRTFELTREGARLRVTHRGIKPDLFKDNAETTITGRLVGDGPDLRLEARPGDEGMRVTPPKW